MSIDTREEQNAVARTILAQLGGDGFAVMTGLKQVAALPDGVRFKIGGGAKHKINVVQVTLTPADDYTVTFLRVSRTKRGPRIITVDECEGIYAENLPDCFRRVTGFETRLPRIVR